MDDLLSETSDPTLKDRAERGEADAQLTLSKLFDQRGADREALHWLRRAAASRHPAAITTLGTRLLSGRGAPLSPQEGILLLMDADRVGATEAPALLAVLCGMGAGLPQSWPNAVESLARAAQRGSDRARRQLRLLKKGPLGDGKAEDFGPEEHLTDWAAAAQTVDIAEWTTPPMKISLSEAPRLRALPRFVSPEVCRWLIDIGAGRVEPALVYDADTGEGQRQDARSNQAFELAVTDLDLVVVLVRARIAAATGVPIAALEPCQILHYAVGQQFSQHYDFLDGAEPGYARDLALRGQRIITFLLYLNEGYEGGETQFPRVDLAFKGAAGDALMFANVDRRGAPDLLTLHAGAAPTAGEKWLYSQWIRDKIPEAIG
jgi:prolyl 4-hydroxylase